MAANILTPTRAREIIQACEFRALLDYNPTTGDLIWRPRPTEGLTGRARQDAVRFNNLRAGKVAGGHNNQGYLMLNRRGVRMPAHRIAWLLMTTCWPADQIDHINGVRDDNRWLNLREATRVENLRNQRARSNSTGFPGVNRNCGKFMARLCSNGTSHFLGNYDTPEAAHQAYLAAAQAHGFDPLHGHQADIRAARTR
jgi:hypothetical protein